MKNLDPLDLVDTALLLALLFFVLYVVDKTTPIPV